MKILHITKEIYPTNKTGLGVSSYFHKKILKEKGNNYKLVTSKSFFGNSHDRVSIDYYQDLGCII